MKTLLQLLGVAIITNASNPLSALTLEAARNLYLGKTRSLPGGAPARLADQPDSSAIYAEFYEKLAGKTVWEMKAHWSRLIFTGQGLPPHQREDDERTIEWIKRTPSGIGYVRDSKPLPGVKVLLRLP